MKIGDLKKAIGSLPDDTEVVVEYIGDDGYRDQNPHLWTKICRWRAKRHGRHYWEYFRGRGLPEGSERMRRPVFVISAN
ncbi:hypothetical protein A3A39_03360 [Candidatus Kaiserbacteria bacterium RIFCSPLOWO2_01_FULL_54_13]|uniref:Uncharacterized protein n=1 Tax=Candidatus Kaiserbacteria bacterium RIFCSPLOWO2_01_FULL_54_13 TaxID=1798512 RepID=A0A1F6F328_9BACT|nr:MAG: hypothetical protein A3A39_03360 [Candidatus Kaiserbacteria bacterium RIFCSPLOWO2_01_FULL_54_13]